MAAPLKLARSALAALTPACSSLSAERPRSEGRPFCRSHGARLHSFVVDQSVFVRRVCFSLTIPKYMVPSGSAFVGVDILPNETVMFGSLSGSRLGIHLAHGEGRFRFSGNESDYIIPVKYSYQEFPGNPNGSDFAAAAVASKDGRHVAVMPHLERSIFPWNWAHYHQKMEHQITPWIEPFVNARNWVKEHK